VKKDTDEIPITISFAQQAVAWAGYDFRILLNKNEFASEIGPYKTAL
jgi:hypothetical protein